MSAIDKVLKVDWSQAEYIGDGVYAMRVDGDIALRADRGEENHVIVFESPMLEELNNFAQIGPGGSRDNSAQRATLS